MTAVPCDICGIHPAATILNLTQCVVCAGLVDNPHDLQAHEEAMAGGPPEFTPTPTPFKVRLSAE
jgi:hypothetical protein